MLGIVTISWKLSQAISAPTRTFQNNPHDIEVTVTKAPCASGDEVETIADSFRRITETSRKQQGPAWHL
jgi:hypothetical protein